MRKETKGKTATRCYSDQDTHSLGGAHVVSGLEILSVSDFAIGVQLAIQSLDKETYLDRDVPKTKLPASVESISILDTQGKVKDSTMSDFINKTYALPSPGETKEGEYYIQLKSTLGVRWILIKTKAH